MKRIFTNLDKYYLKTIDTTIAYEGFKIFKELCFVPSTPRVVELILNYLNQDREGEDIPRALIKSCLQVNLGKILNVSTSGKPEQLKTLQSK